MSCTPKDTLYMKKAIAIAKTGEGLTFPNPCVGCVIVKDSEIIASARTANDGRPHAESIALEIAGKSVQGSTLYVTLEPCAHQGETPSCAEAIIKAGVSKVVIGVLDPDPRTNGQGIQKLKDAGIEVITDIESDSDRCNELHKGFITRQTQNRPYVTLKAACTSDDKIATSAGESKWITGELARRHVHALRSRHEGILVGINTVLKDDPSLTCRAPGVQKGMIRIILDTDLKITTKHKLFEDIENNPLWIMHENDNPNSNELTKAGAQLIKLPSLSDVSVVLSDLAERGLNTLFVEGGGKVHASFLKTGFFDELLIYRAPTVIGAEGLPVFAGMDINPMIDNKSLKHIKTQRVDDDVLEKYKKEVQE